jgi:hypothetical protein
MNRATHSTLALVAAMVLPAIAGATTRRVPSQYPTIHQALDAAAIGDSVLVAAGIYSATTTRLLSGTIYQAAGFLRSGVTLVSELGPTATTIQVNSSGSNVHCLVSVGTLTTEDPVRVVGFTFRKPNPTGAGIIVAGNPTGTRLEVVGCRFLGIAGGDQAGAIHIWSGSLTVGGSTFTQCTGGTAGAVAAWEESQEVELSSCHFTSCVGDFFGGGVSSFAAETRVSRSDFITCHGDYGGGLYCRSALMTVDECRFQNNLADLAGGGVFWSRYLGQGWLRGSVVMGNEARGTGRGGGIFWDQVGADVTNNTFVGNVSTVTDPAFTGTAAARLLSYGGTFNNNVIAENQGEMAVRFVAEPLVETCNVYWNNPLGHLSVPLAPTSRIADPQFCPAAGASFPVRATSPCLPENSLGCQLIGAYKVGCSGLSVFVDTAPDQGLQLVIDGIVRTSPYYPDLTSWAPGTQHVLEAIPIQDSAIEHPTEYWQFSNWSDGGDTVHVVTIPSVPVHYSARYVAKPKTPVQVEAAPLSSLDLLVDGTPVSGDLFLIPGSTHSLEAVSPQPDVRIRMEVRLLERRRCAVARSRGSRDQRAVRGDVLTSPSRWRSPGHESRRAAPSGGCRHGDRSEVLHARRVAARVPADRESDNASGRRRPQSRLRIFLLE